MGRPLPTNLARTEPEATDVILGMPGPWAEDNSESSDHYTTKIGGLPDWPMSVEEVNDEYLKCGLCAGDLALVAQVYAPVTVHGTRIDERTLYVFGCPSSNCGISPLSWRTIRVQSNVAAGSSQGGSRVVGSTAEAAGSTAEAAGSSAVELTGEDSSEGERTIGSEQQHHASDWWDIDTWGPGTGEEVEQEAFLAMEELETALLEAGYAAATPLRTLGLDIREEVIAVQEDEIADNNDPGVPVLPCFYVYSQNESHPSRGSRAVSALQTTEHLEEIGESDEIAGADEIWEGEEYEHDRALSADRTYLKFKKRLDCYPEQCFRYCLGGCPLWANKDIGEPGVCLQCGGPRVYEMQLMPPLLYYMQQACKDQPSTPYSPNDWEWLTLIVFTCAQSCTPAPSCSSEEGHDGQRKSWIVSEEVTILQYET